MARAPELLVAQSILDRLSTVEDWPVTRIQSIRFLRDSIKRNLEWLLNTRRPPVAGIEGYPLARHTVLYYGLLDLGSLSLASSNDQQRLQQRIAEMVEHSEPRLRQVEVRLQEGDLERKKLRFHIGALMQMKPLPEEIVFDTVLDLATGEYQVD
ncbi:type VI secretion system baseplate subunit TssE [Granulicella sp. dw_53]|uniref:type VI secretion system baseplate subunit TssE n=1 Tax=Granulicella sp. dw_53 TaxID=2719792 RepID=UPI001BD25C1B|nr:type VI secretion system baseplate subunit TssE [Granulicella sp. dw_53]